MKQCHNCHNRIFMNDLMIHSSPLSFDPLSSFNSLFPLSFPSLPLLPVCRSIDDPYLNFNGLLYHACVVLSLHNNIQYSTW